MKQSRGETTAVLAALFILILGGGYWWHAQSIVPAAPVPVATGEATSSESSGTVASTTFTEAEVAAHNSAQSCYTSIDGSVYDLTAWISEHPGGPEAILSLCGTDGTVAFTGQHGNQRRPNNELASFKIGTLVP